MSNFYKDTMNIPIIGAEYGFNGVVVPEYARGHRAALIAASKIALDADVRVNSLETDLAAANAEITRLREAYKAKTDWTATIGERAAKVAAKLAANDYNTQAMEAMADDMLKLEAEIARLRSGGCAREQGTTQWCAEAQQLESRYRTLLVAIDECLSSNPQPLPRIVALLTDPLRNPSSGVMQVAKRGIAAELNVEDFDRDTARRMGLFDE